MALTAVLATSIAPTPVSAVVYTPILFLPVPAASTFGIQWSVQCMVGAIGVTLHVALFVDGVGPLLATVRRIGDLASLQGVIAGHWLSAAAVSVELRAQRSGVGVDPTVTERTLQVLDHVNNTVGPQGVQGVQGVQGAPGAPADLLTTAALAAAIAGGAR